MDDGGFIMKNNIIRTGLFATLGLLGFLVAMSAQRFVRESQEAQAQMRAELDERLQDEDFRQQLVDAAESQRLLAQQFTEVLGQLPEATVNDTYERRPDDTRVIAEEVPESVAGRGLIILGAPYGEYPEGGMRCRSPRGDYNWKYDYTTDCNLFVPTNSIELTEFAQRFDAEPSYPSKEPDFPTYYCAVIHDGVSRAYQIFRTDFFSGDCTEGFVYESGDPGHDVNIFFDPTGKYIFYESYDSSENHDALLMAFLEPVMVKVETAFQSSEDSETIARFVNGIHSLEATLTNGVDAASLLASDDKGCVSFTAENGMVHDYYYTQDHYLIYGNTVYYVEDLSPLLDVMSK